VQGNLLLDRMLGADIAWAGDQALDEAMVQVAEELQAAGRHPYVVPYGGSNPIGASGYVAAMEELLAQCTDRNLYFDHVVLASSSGGTQAGLMVGARALEYGGRILGISVDLEANALQHRLANLATATAEHLGLGMAFAPEDSGVEDAYLGGGYGVVGDLERGALHTMARTEASFSIRCIPAGPWGACWTWCSAEHSDSTSVCSFGTQGGPPGCSGMATSYSERPRG